MLNTIKYLKEIYINSVVNYMSFENGGADLPQEQKDQLQKLRDSHNAGEEIKVFKQMIEDGIIDKNEAIVLKIASEKEGILEEQTKPVLNEIVNSMILNGFSSNNEKSHNAYVVLIEKRTGQKIPNFQKIKDALLENLTSLSKTDGGKLVEQDFRGIHVRNGVLNIRYNSFGFDDTLEIEYDPKTGEIIKGSNDWVDKNGQNNVFENKATVDSELLDDNTLLQKEEKQERVTASSSEVNNLNNDFKVKAQALRNFANDLLKQDGYTGGKVRIGSRKGKPTIFLPTGNFMTIPEAYQNENNRIIKIFHGNKEKMENPQTFYDEFVAKHLGVKTISQRVDSVKQDERITANVSLSEKNNTKVKERIQINIDEIKKEDLLPDGIDLIFNSKKQEVQIIKNNTKINSYIPNLKNSDNKYIKGGEQNIQLNIPYKFKKWVKDSIK